MSVTVDSNVMLQILSSQEVATGELWLRLKLFKGHGKRGFCVYDGFICRACPK